MFFYLLCVVPAIWFLELHQMEFRIERRSTIRSNLSSAVAMLVDNDTQRKLRAEIEGLGVRCFGHVRGLINICVSLNNMMF